MATDDYQYLPVNPTTLPATFNFATDIVDYWARKDPSQLALYWIDQSLSTTRKLTYSHLSEQSHRIAHLLTDLGLKPGDTVILILPRLPEWWAIATACLRAGIILCPCTTLLVEKDIEYRLQVSHASAFIGDETSVAKCLAVRSNSHKLKQIIQISTSSNVSSHVTDFHTAVAKQPTTTFSTPSTLTPTSPALTFFTSGTTGPPKIVLHSATSYPLAHALTGVHWLNLTPSHHSSGQSLYWNLSEQGWAKAAWSFFSTWNCGACLFIHDDQGAFSARRTLEVLHRFPITTLCAPPTVYRQLVLDENRKLFEGVLRPKALRHACGAGEPLNEGVIKTWRGMSGGMEIRDGYGQTESILVCANMVGKKVKLGSMGLPVPGVPLRVLDADGRELEFGKEGDIAIEVGGKEDGGFFGLYEGYIDKNTGKLDRNIKSFSGNGGRTYYLTGDRATRDEDGYFWFVGRSDDVINSSGYRIGPFEVESVLKLHPAVVESAVVASPDPQRDEVVKAFVVLTDSAAADIKKNGQQEGSENLLRELQDFCKSNAAPYKYPRKIQFVDSTFLPKTISGKIKRSELKKMEKEKYQDERGRSKL